MSARWAAVTVDCVEPERVAAFYAELLGTEPRPVGRPGWLRVGPLREGAPALTFQPVPERRAGKTRVHLDLRVDDLEEAVDRVARLGGSGPVETHRYDEGTVLVMGDPEGNVFCLVALVPGAELA